jgi:molybdopterin/thiamine biosynthesis adenylyltransferase
VAPLSDATRERYARQLMLPGWSEEVQLALGRRSALVVGAGALGSVVGQYLAAAGVGRLGVLDDDEVELSNLQRQILHYTPDVGLPKAASAAAKLRFLNPEVVIEEYRARLGPDNAGALVLGQDVVVDGSDTFATRYRVNDACCAASVPLVEGGALALSGMVMSIRPGASACYRCAFPRAPLPGTAPTCAEAGVLGPVAGVVGALQALEALKLLTGLGDPLLDRFLEIDGASSRLTEVATERRRDCPACQLATSSTAG